MACWLIVFLTTGERNDLRPRCDLFYTFLLQPRVLVALVLSSSPWRSTFYRLPNMIESALLFLPAYCNSKEDPGELRRAAAPAESHKVTTGSRGHVIKSTFWPTLCLPYTEILVKIIDWVRGTSDVLNPNIVPRVLNCRMGTIATMKLISHLYLYYHRRLDWCCWSDIRQELEGVPYSFGGLDESLTIILSKLRACTRVTTIPLSSFSSSFTGTSPHQSPNRIPNLCIAGGKLSLSISK